MKLNLRLSCCGLVLSGAMLLPACSSASQNATQAALRLNPEVTLQLEHGALHNHAPIKLGAGDRFGNSLHDQFVAAVQAEQEEATARATVQTAE